MFDHSDGVTFENGADDTPCKIRTDDAISVQALRGCAAQRNLLRGQLIYRSLGAVGSLRIDVGTALSISTANSTISTLPSAFWALSENEHELSVEMRNSLMAFHGQRGDLDAAMAMFDGIDEAQRDAVTMNALTSAYLDC